MNNHTLGGIFERSGVGLHSGILTKVRVLPAAAGEGRYFVRVDLPELPIIPARVDAVSQTRLSTELRIPTMGEPTGLDASVRTVEHLLAALAGSGVDDARIEIDGSEVPLLDGSALVWVEAILEVGVVAQDGVFVRGRGRGGEGEFLNSGLRTGNKPSQGHRVAPSPLHPLTPSPPHPLTPSPFLKEPVSVYQGDAFVTAMPAPTTRFTYGIDFDNPAIGKQWYSFLPEQESFAEAIAPARTFCEATQIEQMRQAGLIKGGSLDNALVCSDSGWLNPSLRFSNEPVRHKLLDLVGDLSLLGTFPVAHFLAYKASHNLHIQLAKKLAQQMG
ncbi:MAG TPA: UDP-3-O-acyl-N-acetylglucosamine deacetylase [Oculatellaceae cyanobacterium]